MLSREVGQICALTFRIYFFLTLFLKIKYLAKKLTCVSLELE